MVAATAEQLNTLLGQQVDTTRLDAVLAVVKAMAATYTRGQGFTNGDPAEDLAAVILTASARLLVNPSQVPHRDRMGAVESDWRGGFIGWTLVELAVLNRYRERAQ